MAKYRKKPVVVDAEQFLENMPLPFASRRFVVCWDGVRWYVTTAHGQAATVVHGDWIIAEPDGRGYYPCKPDIFEASYELVKE